MDENPFERREITVEVTDSLGHEVSATASCSSRSISSTKPQVTSVLVEASVQDKQGRVRQGLCRSTQFSVLEDGVPQQLDLAQQEALGAPSRC